ncbi:MAG: hypothetical protein DI537_13905 [Stutzerimonas stutzeri]|nr:MAG: hypothetical protein DI537_13905 [Stutzerimonas stutzeri]
MSDPLPCYSQGDKVTISETPKAVARRLATESALLESSETKSTPLPGLPVAGYRPQDPKNVELVNRNKVLEEHVLRQIDLHKADQNHDQRLVALAKTHVDLAFMLLNRAVFQPGRLTGDLPPL